MVESERVTRGMVVEETEKQFTVAVYSFGFKYGAPEDATMLMDVRFLPNPYWEDSMRHLTGRTSEVAEYVLESDGGREYMRWLFPMLKFLIAQNRQVGKAGMRIAIGCTGGHHRSVAVVERLAELLQGEDVELQVSHRDIEKE